MTTPNLGLPKISNNMSADVVRDMNALAEAVDANAAKKGDLAALLADYSYQTPTISGTQVRISKQSGTKRLFFKLDAKLSGGNITISTDGGATSKPLQDVDGSPVTQLDKGFVEVVADAAFFTLRNQGNGRKKFASGVAVVSGSDYAASLTVSGLNFKPSVLIIYMDTTNNDTNFYNAIGVFLNTPDLDAKPGVDDSGGNFGKYSYNNIYSKSYSTTVFTESGFSMTTPASSGSQLKWMAFE